ncbi:MAG: hypothetical protein KC425_13380 [Anaerolineales bacterium]|nr:hypothetical protein [Anaerolineales bacterium]
MTRQPARFLPPTLLLLSLALGLAACYLFYLNQHTAVPASWGAAGGARDTLSGWANILLQGPILSATAAALGLLITRRRPGNRIGWLLLAVGLGSGAMTFGSEWAVFGAFTRPGGAPGWQLAAWSANWLWIIVFAGILYLLAVFPNGRFLSPRWRTAIGLSLLLFILPFLVAAALETPMSSAFQIANPFVRRHPAQLYNALSTVASLALPTTTLAVLAAIGLRFRRSRGRERQQMKWLLAGVSLFAALVVAGLALALLVQIPAGGILVNGAALAPLLGIGVALLRHRLYDIDVIIRKTLAYALLTALLALVYFGAVVLGQQLLTAVSGQSSPLVVALSTLLIAALFNPLRHRAQAFVDRRFYRQKVDAQRMLARFSRAARDEVQVEALTAELLHIIRETMQPETAVIWLPSSASQQEDAA